MAQQDVQEQIRRASEVQAKYADMLMRKSHVVGVGIGFARKDDQETGEIALVVMVDEKLPLAQLDTDDIIPERLDGVRVDVQQTGDFTSLPG
ncbi:MAG: hypothetical protein DIU68_017755 [Chloroflexota bacterium]|nr:MAG: hypothetical protein DIU68_21410 [Chloroflexota bacterium]